MSSNEIINKSQQKAAKVAGFMFLAIIAVAIFGEFFLLDGVFVEGDITTTVTNLVDNEQKFRVTVATELITFTAVTILALALYVILKPVNKTLAQLALFWRLGETAVYAIILFNRYIVLILISEADYLSGFETEQLHGLVGLFLDAYNNGYTFGIIFFSLGSTVFAYLFYKSNYIPKLLAALGIFASLAVLVGAFSSLILPHNTTIELPPYGLFIFAFEVFIGLWLLIKGLKIPQQTDNESLALESA